MELTIKARPRHLQLTPQLRAHVEAKMAQATAGVPATGDLHIEVALRHQAHSAGGAHQSCRVVLLRPHARAVEVRAVDKDMYRAIDRLQRRLHRVLRHQADRAGDGPHRRRPLGQLCAAGHPPLAAPGGWGEAAASGGDRPALA